MPETNGEHQQMFTQLEKLDGRFIGLAGEIRQVGESVIRMEEVGKSSQRLLEAHETRLNEGAQTFQELRLAHVTLAANMKALPARCDDGAVAVAKWKFYGLFVPLVAAAGTALWEAAKAVARAGGK